MTKSYRKGLISETMYNVTVIEHFYKYEYSAGGIYVDGERCYY